MNDIKKLIKKLEKVEIKYIPNDESIFENLKEQEIFNLGAEVHNEKIIDMLKELLEKEKI